MTTITPIEMERKVRQLNNDVQAIYQMLTGITDTQTKHGDRLDHMDAKLNGIAATQLRHGNRLDEVEAKLDEITATQARHGNRFDEVDAKFDQLDTKLETIITMLGERGS